MRKSEKSELLTSAALYLLVDDGDEPIEGCAPCDNDQPRPVFSISPGMVAQSTVPLLRRRLIR